MEDNLALSLEKGTLQEAIANDRRITARNVFKWLDHVLNILQLYHRSFASVGEFGVGDISIGYSQQLKESVAFGENLLTILKANQSASDALKLDKKEPERELNEGERLATLDFRKRIQDYTSKLPDTANSRQDLVVRSTTAPVERSTLPRGFSCPKLLKFDFKHDNNVCIPKDNGDHHALVHVYRDYVQNVCQDYRCLGIIILQIYSLCAFPADECSRLMRYEAPAPPPKTEEEAVEDAPQAPHRQSMLSGHGAPPPGSADAGGRRASVSASSTTSGGRKSLVTPPIPANNASPPKGTKNAKPAPASGAGTTASTGAKAGATGLAGAAAAAPAAPPVVEPKKRTPRPPRLPNPLEQQLLQMYPCIARMPAEIKDLFLNICFVRPADVLVERTVKARGEMCTKFEFALLVMAKDVKYALHSIVEQLQEDAHYEPQSCWTAADEKARLAAYKERQDRYAMMAQQGPLNAERRLAHEKYLLWYSLQSEDFKIKLEARNRARRRAERNTIMRRKFIYRASFHRWTMLNFTSWVHEALLEYSNMLQGLRHTAQLDKKKKKKPAVYVARLINDLLAVYTKTAVAKLVAYRIKRQEEDSVGWEDSLLLIKPSTSGGPRPGTRGESLLVAATAAAGAQMPADPFADDGSVQSAMTRGSLGSRGSNSNSMVSKPTDRPTTQVRLPDIRSKSPSRNDVKSRNNGRRKKVVEEVKVKTEDEILVECFTVLASQLAKLITHKMRNPLEFCRNIRESIKAQEKETAEALAERMLVTSEEQLYFKRLSMQAGYFTSYTKHLRGCVLEFSDAIDLVDRGWAKFVVYLISSAIMHHFHSDLPNRTKGENYAADRIIAFFRRIVVRNIVARVWKRTNLMYMASLSPQGSAKNSPAMSLRKQSAMGLASGSGDTRDSGGSRKRTQQVVISPDHSLPTTKSAPPPAPLKGDVPERRKPFFIKDVHAPTGKTMLIDMSVSIESDEHVDGNTVNIRAARRQAARYEVWKNVQCFAYVETDVSQEPTGQPAKQVIADSAMFSAGAFHSSTPAANINPGKGIESPVPRRLIVHLGKKNAHHPEQHAEDGSVKRTAVKAALTVVEHVAAPDEDDVTSLGDYSLQSNTLKNAMPSNYKTASSKVAQPNQERRLSAAELAWDDRTLESVPVGSSGVHQGTGGQPVITYHIALDNLLAYSCYSVQFVLDKALAEDLRDGNKTFFRYLNYTDDDDISMHSEESTVVGFAQVGKQWAIAEEEAEANEVASGVVSAAPSGSPQSGLKSHTAEGLKVELAQYVYTRPAIPRSVKGLTARVAYHSTDAAYTFTGADQVPMLQYTAVPHQTGHTSDHHEDTHHEVMKTLQGGIEVRWMHSLEDTQSNTHYEVQRRLLLVNCAQATPSLQLPPSRPSTNSNKRKEANRKKDEPAPAAPTPVEELVYVGPWKHVAGLKSSLRNANISSGASVTSAGSMGFASSKKAASKGAALHSASAKSGGGAAADWSFLSSPHHGTTVTDRVSLPAELDTNPDAYNLVMGYLCARFPDLVVHGADGAQLTSDAVDAHREAQAHAAALLQRVVESGLTIGLEYRVRAVNSAGLGKFSACTANLPLQPAQSTTIAPVAGKVNVCTVQLARVCAHLAQLCEFRSRHPKYHSQNSDLVSMILVQRAETAKNADLQLIERSGDPFVDYLVDLKDGTTSPGKETQQKESGEAKEEIDEISAWIHSLELECPIK